MEVGWDPVLVTLRFWINGGRLGPHVGDVTFLDQWRSVGPRVGDVTFFNHGGQLGTPVNHITFFGPQEVSWGPP